LDAGIIFTRRIEREANNPAFACHCRLVHAVAPVFSATPSSDIHPDKQKPHKTPHSTSNSPHLYQQNLPIPSLQIPTNTTEIPKKIQQNPKFHHNSQQTPNILSSTDDWSNQIS
jgi:hypothetical protein